MRPSVTLRTRDTTPKPPCDAGVGVKRSHLHACMFMLEQRERKVQLHFAVCIQACVGMYVCMYTYILHAYTVLTVASCFNTLVHECACIYMYVCMYVCMFIRLTVASCSNTLYILTLLMSYDGANLCSDCEWQTAQGRALEPRGIQSTPPRKSERTHSQTRHRRSSRMPRHRLQSISRRCSLLGTAAQ